MIWAPLSEIPQVGRNPVSSNSKDLTSLGPANTNSDLPVNSFRFRDVPDPNGISK